MGTGTIHVGVGGWSFAPWRGRFFPAGLPHAQELAWSAARLNGVEVNGTFYRTQTPETFAKWRAQVPDGFRFALKAPRYATNRRNLAEAGESIARFLGSGLDRLGEALGPINWQLPPTKRYDADELAAFLSLLPPSLDGRPLRHALEVRHPSFADAPLAALAARHGVAIVRAGDSEWPEIDAPAQGFAYLRIMGAEPGGYPAARLDHWAAEAKRLAAGGRDVFLFVISGAKEENPAAALALMERLGIAAPGSSGG